MTPPAAASCPAAPPFPHSCPDESPPHSSAESPNESTSISPASQSEISPCSSAAQVESVCSSTRCSSEDSLPAAAQLPVLPAVPSAAECTELGLQSSSCQPPARSSALFVPAAPSQALPQSSHPPPGPAPAFQPFFFSGTFPCNVKGNKGQFSSFCCTVPCFCYW